MQDFGCDSMELRGNLPRRKMGVPVVKGKGQCRKRRSPSPPPSSSKLIAAQERRKKQRRKQRSASPSSSSSPSPSSSNPIGEPFTPLKRKRGSSLAQTPPTAPKSLAKMSRWQPPHVEFDRRKVFCMTKSEAHEVYNLNNSGQDPRTICEDIFSEKDWLQVFTEVPKRGSKIKCKIVRKQYWESFYTLFTSVYQEPPRNYGMEVTRAFGKGFLYEQVKGTVDWATFAESIVAHMEAGKLQAKRQRWAVFHSPVGLASSRERTLPPDLDACNRNTGSKLHVPVRMDFGQLDDLVGLVAGNHNKALQELHEVSKQIEGTKATLHRNEGAMALIESKKKQLESARARVRELELLEDTSLLQWHQRRVANLEMALELFTDDLEDVDHVDGLDMAQMEFERKQLDVKIKGAQLQFVKDMQSRKSAVLFQVPPPKVPKNEFESDRATFCGACGVALFDDEVLGICMLPCRHAYHMYCFAHIAANGENCLVSGCSQVISENVKSWVSIDSGNTSYGAVKIGKKFDFFYFCDCNGSSFLCDKYPVLVSYQ